MSQRDLEREESRREGRLSQMLQEGHAAGAAHDFVNQERLYRECVAGWDALILARILRKPATENRQLSHTGICAALTSLASLLGERGRHAEAEAVARRLLEIAERRKRDKHSLTFALRCVADAVGAQGRCEEAEVLTRRELRLYEQLGRGESYAQQALGQMAWHWLSVGNHERVRACAEEAARIQTSKPLPDVIARLLTVGV